MSQTQRPSSTPNNSSNNSTPNNSSLTQENSDFQKRVRLCNYIQACGIPLKMPQPTIYTASVFFHKFFEYHSFSSHDASIVATTCLFLAGKVEESPRKLREVIEVCYKVRKGKEIDINDPQYSKTKNIILELELEILKTIGFDLNVDQPYKYVLSGVRAFNGTKHLAQVAWNFVNDSFRTTLSLRYNPKAIAASAIWLAARYLSYPLESAESKPWWTVFDSSTPEIEEIADEIMKVYPEKPFGEGNQPPSNDKSNNSNSNNNNSNSNNSNSNSNNSNNNSNNSNNSNNNNNSNNSNNSSNSSNHSNNSQSNSRQGSEQKDYPDRHSPHHTRSSSGEHKPHADHYSGARASAEHRPQSDHRSHSDSASSRQNSDRSNQDYHPSHNSHTNSNNGRSSHDNYSGRPNPEYHPNSSSSSNNGRNAHDHYGARPALLDRPLPDTRGGVPQHSHPDSHHHNRSGESHNLRPSPSGGAEHTRDQYHHQHPSQHYQNSQHQNSQNQQQSHHHYGASQASRGVSERPPLLDRPPYESRPLLDLPLKAVVPSQDTKKFKSEEQRH